MEPVQEELPPPPPAQPKSTYGSLPPFTQVTPKHHVYSDKPSLKYKNIDEAMKLGLSMQAFSPPRPILPRQVFVCVQSFVRMSMVCACVRVYLPGHHQSLDSSRTARCGFCSNYVRFPRSQLLQLIPKSITGTLQAPDTEDMECNDEGEESTGIQLDRSVCCGIQLCARDAGTSAELKCMQQMGARARRLTPAINN